MRRVNVLVAATLAALIAAPVNAAVELKPYGFVLGTFTENFGQPTRTDDPTMAVSQNSGNVGHNQTISNFSARGTRFGLKLNGGKGPLDTDLSGVIEMDFNGIQDQTTTSGANQDVNASPRIRLAYVQAKKGMNTFTFGHDWVQAFAPLNPTSLHHVMVSIGTSAGNLWNRLDQLRWDADWLNGSDTDIVTKVAVARAPTTDATVTAAPTSGETFGSTDVGGQPMYQGLAEVHQKLMNRTFVVGVSGSYSRHEYTEITSPSVNHHADDGLVAVHVSLPVLDMVSLQGEAFYGRGTQSYKGLDKTFVDTTAGGVTGKYALSRGGWGQVMVTPMAGWHVGAFYGIENMDRTGLTALASNTAYRNENAMANIIWDVSPEMSLSIEGGRIYTRYSAAATGGAGTDPGKMGYLGLASQYKF